MSFPKTTYLVSLMFPIVTFREKRKKKGKRKMMQAILSNNTLSHKLGKVSVTESCRYLNV